MKYICTQPIHSTPMPKTSDRFRPRTADYIEVLYFKPNPLSKGLILSTSSTYSSV